MLIVLTAQVIGPTEGGKIAARAEEYMQTIYSPTGDEIYQIIISDTGKLKIIGHHYGGVSTVTYQTVGFFVSMKPQNSDIRTFLKNGGKGYELRFDNETSKYVNDVNNNGLITTTYSFPDNIFPELFRIFNIPSNSTGTYDFYVSNIFRVIKYPEGRGKPFVYISDACYSLDEIRKGAGWGYDTLVALGHYYDMKFTIKRSWIKPTNTPTPTKRPTNTPTPTKRPTNTPTPTKRPTNTPTPTKRPTNTPTPTKRPTYTPTPTPRPTNTPTPRPTNTPTPTLTPTNTPTPSFTPTPTPFICKIVVGGDNNRYVQLVTPPEEALHLVIEDDSSMNDFYLRMVNNVSGTAGNGELRNLIRFPFILYDDLEFSGNINNAVRILPMTWYEVGDTLHHFMTSTDLVEGDYKIEGRTVEKLYPGMSLQTQKTATDKIDVCISGRLTDLMISKARLVSENNLVKYRYFSGIYDRFGKLTRKEALQLPAEISDKSEAADISVLTCGKQSAEGSVVIKAKFRTTAGETVKLFYYETLPSGARRPVPFQDTIVLSASEYNEPGIAGGSLGKKQLWTGNIYFPSDMVAVRTGSGSSPYSGKVIVNFDIMLFSKNGEKVLSYANIENEAKGFCNMWTFQDFQTKKADASEDIPNIKQGDVFILNVGDTSATGNRVRLLY